ncbi:MAG: hypothetical protein RSB38_01900 [Oscillospiraceae bacterium]
MIYYIRDENFENGDIIIMKNIAIIDIGSNSIRLDVVQIKDADNDYEYLERVRFLTRLSEGMGEDMRLQPLPMERTLETLIEYKKIIDKYEVTEIFAVATAAVRLAQNGDDFCTKIMDECGIPVEVISGEREAEYAFEAAISSVDIEDFIVVDTGGGSTEFILVSANEALARVSLPLGAVNLTDSFFSYGENADSVAAARDFVASQIDKIKWLDDDTYGLPVVGLGGSIYSLGIVDKSLSGSSEDLNGYTIPAQTAINVSQYIVNMSDDERESEGVEPGRLDTVVCGQLPVCELMKKISSDELIISTASIREGMLLEILNNI